MNPERAELTPAVRAVGAMGLGCVALAAASTAVTHRFLVGSLVWNLFLAFIPLALALVISTLESRGRGRLALALGVPWLLFLPNSPYLLTDFVHLQVTPHRWIWGHLLLIAWCGITGLFAGLLSVRVLHPILGRRLGPGLAWTALTLVNLLTGIGVALGRFQRWNSWDVLHRPRSILRDVIHTLPGQSLPAESLLAFGFGALFAMAYLVLWSLRPCRPLAPSGAFA